MKKLGNESTEKYIHHIICLVVSIVGIIMVWVYGNFLLLLGILLMLWGNNIQMNMHWKEEERKKEDREFIDRQLEKLRHRIEELKKVEELKVIKDIV